MTPWLEMIYPSSHVVPQRCEGEPASPKMSPLTGSPTYSCVTCKRTLVPGELYADGFRDGIELCHACRRDAFERSFVEAEESIEHGDDFPRPENYR